MMGESRRAGLRRFGIMNATLVKEEIAQRGGVGLNFALRN